MPNRLGFFSHIAQFLREHAQEKLNDPTAWQDVFLDQVVKRVPELFDDETGD